MVFGDKSVEKITEFKSPVADLRKVTTKAGKLISRTEAEGGYALVFGPDIKILKGLIAGTSLSIIAYEKDALKVQALREYFNKLASLPTA